MGKLAEVLAHPEELLPLVRRLPRTHEPGPSQWATIAPTLTPCPRSGVQIKMYRSMQSITKLPDDPDLAFCYGILNSVSRRYLTLPLHPMQPALVLLVPAGG